MKDRTEFIIPGEPMGKQRPKFSTFGGYGKAYTPKETVSYQNLVKMCWSEKVGEFMFPDSEMGIGAEITAFYAIPKSTSKKKAQKMKDHLIMATKKPDADNIAKIILDALNGIAFSDDRNVTELKVKKEYTEDGRAFVKVALYALEEGDINEDSSEHGLTGEPEDEGNAS